MTERSKLRVLHTVDPYLTTHTNWIYRLLLNLPDTQVVVASRNFLAGGFYANDFEYIRFPLRLREPPASLFVRANNFFAGRAIRAYPWYVSKVARKIDVVHSHFAPCAWLYRSVARRLGVPHVVSYYGYDYEHLPYLEPVWHERYKSLFAEADAFICEGAHGAATLERIGCPKNKIHVVRLGLAPATIPFCRRQKKPGGLKLLQVASFIAKKGHLDTMRAFLEALKECPDMTLTLVGREPDFSKDGIMKKVKDMLTPATRDKVIFVDGVAYEKLYDFMAGFDVFIHPSCYTAKRDCEGGAPVVLLDAQATGMPVIATTHCDIPEEVINGETGLLTPENDAGQLAQSIKRFYHMEADEYQSFSTRARRQVEANYDIARNAASLREVYGEVKKQARGN